MKVDRGFYVEEAVVTRLKRIAGEHEISPSRALELCVKNYPTADEAASGDLPDVVEGFLTLFGKALKRTRRELIESIIINYLAQRTADEEVNAGYSETVPMPEFSNTSRGPMLGKELFLFLKKLYVEVLTKYKAQNFNVALRALGSPREIPGGPAGGAN